MPAGSSSTDIADSASVNGAEDNDDKSESERDTLKDMAARVDWKESDK